MTEEKRCTNSRYELSTRAGALIEQHRLYLRIFHVDALAEFEPECHAALDRWPRLHSLQPALEVRKFVDVLPLPFPAIHPTDQRHVGDGIFAGDEWPILEADVHDTVKAVHLVDVAVDRIGQCFHGVILEVVDLARHRPDATHLPEQPLIDLDARAFVGGIKLSGLAPEILQDRTGLENGDWPPAGPLRV